MKLFWIGTLSAFILSCSSANKQEAIESPLPESQIVDGKTLTLLGSGFRIASKMGFTAKVYKAGLYAEKKGASGTELLESSSPKKLFMRFTYTVNKAPLVEAWKNSYAHSCVKNCDQENASFKKFIDILTPMSVGQTMELVFKPQGIEISINKETQTKTTIDSKELSFDILSIFIGEKVLDPKFKKDLLGQ